MGGFDQGDPEIILQELLCTQCLLFLFASIILA
ncbi:hypothetical protein NC652_029657 [Populus alba x Populus x berolinensis]|nr:hypothetical protein NC652_029657 [Populus alba x Populus x berolinensis]